jgi:hypothetical protein
MISDFVIEWDLSKDSFDEERLDGEIFKKGFECLVGTFNFEFDGMQKHDDCTEIISFKKEIDWNSKIEDRTFNLFYGRKVKDLVLVLIYKDKSQGIKIHDNHLYCIPYWMTYKFMSNDKKHIQELINVKIWSDKRPKNILTGKFW